MDGQIGLKGTGFAENVSLRAKDPGIQVRQYPGRRKTAVGVLVVMARPTYARNRVTDQCR